MNWRKTMTMPKRLIAVVCAFFALTLALPSNAVLKINTSVMRELHNSKDYIIPRLEPEEYNIENIYDYNLYLFKRYIPLNLISSRDIFYEQEKQVEKKVLKSRNVPNVYSLSLSGEKEKTYEEKIAVIDDYENKKQYPQALKLYRELISEQPQRIEFLYKFALCLDKAKDYNGAITTLNKILKLDPNFALGYFVKGNVYYKMGKFQEALAQYSNTIKKNPYCADAFYNIGCILEKLNENKLALEYYRGAVSLKPDDSEAKNSIFRLENQLSRL